MRIILLLLNHLAGSDDVPTIQNSPPVTTVCTDFSVTILTINSIDNSISTVNLEIYVVLLSSNLNIITTKSCHLQDSSGCTISGYSIQSAGDYYFQVADTSNTILSSTNIFAVVSSLQAISITSSPTQPSANFNFFLSVQLSDLCGTLITGNNLITLASVPSISGSLSASTSNGMATFTVYTTTFGSYNITATSGAISNYIILNILQNLIKISSLTPDPMIVFDLFNLVVKVLSNSGASVATGHGPFTITLSVNPTATLSGILTADTINGVAHFYNISIDQPGLYTISASSLNMIPGSSVKSYQIDPFILTTILIALSSASASVNFYFQAHLELFDQLGRVWNTTSIVTLTSDKSFTGANTNNSVNGVSGFSIYSSISGPMNLIFTSEAISNSTIINISQNILKIQLTSSIPTTTNSVFSLKVSVFDSSLSLVETLNGAYSISLSLIPSGTLTGSASISTINGVASFTNLKITTENTYRIQATCTDTVAGLTDSMLVIQLVVSSLTIVPPVTVTSNFDFDVTVNIRDQFGSPWLDPLVVTLMSEASITGTTILNTSTGSCTYSLVTSQSGVFLFTVSTIYISNQMNIKIYPNALNITTTLGNKLYVDTPFNVIVDVTDHNFSAIETKYGVYTINLGLLSAGKAVWNLSTVSLQGRSYFSGIKVPNLGYYQLTAAAPGCANSSISTPDATFGPIASMDILLNQTLIYAKYIYTLQLNSFNTSGKLLPYNNTVSVYNHGVLLITRNVLSGYVDFQLFFNHTGDNYIDFVSDGLNTTSRFFIRESNNTDPMCLVAKDSGICYKCIGEANSIIDGKCQCTDYSTYNVLNNTCDCSPGLTASRGYCIYCGNYFQSTEIFAYYDSDYRSIALQFARPVNTTTLLSCFDIISRTDALIALFPECKWLNSQTLKISLSGYPNITENFINLNSTRVQAQGSKCGFDFDPLRLPVNIVYNLPTIASVISAPETVYIGCNDSNVMISTSTVNSLYKYQWSASMSPQQDSIIQLIQSTESHTIIIPSSMLIVSVLQVSLNISIPALKVSATFSTKISILELKIFYIQLSSGSFLKIPNNQDFIIESVLFNACEFDEFEFKWSSGSGISLDKFLSPKPSALIIRSKALNVGVPYIFQLTVTSKGLSASASTTLEVLSSDLILSLSRSTGTISLTQPLTIMASAVDPDDPSSPLTYKWTCISNNNPCTDKFNNSLTPSTNQSFIQISNTSLSNLQKYLITVEVAFKTKRISRDLVFTVDSRLQGDVKLPWTEGRVSKEGIISALGQVSVQDGWEFEWEADGRKVGGGVTGISLDTGGFLVRKEYAIRLKAGLAGNWLVVAENIVHRNMPPNCQGVNGVIDGFQARISAIGCIDGDNQDYPLFYQFGVVSNASKQIFLTGSQIPPVGSVIFPQDAKNFLVNVCDSLESCSFFISLKIMTRRLQSFPPLSLLNFPDKLPSLLVYLSSFELNTTTTSLLLSSFISYTTTESFSTHSSFFLYLQSLSNLLLHDLPSLTQLFDSLSRILGEYDGRLYDSDVKIILTAISRILDRIDKEVISELVEKLREKWMRKLVPSIVKKVEGKLSLECRRDIVADLQGKKLGAGGAVVIVPKSGIAELNNVIDACVAYYEVNSTLVVDIQLTLVGKYESYNLLMGNETQITGKLPKPFIVEVENRFGFEFGECREMKTENGGSCSVNSVSKKLISIESYSGKGFWVQVGKEKCSGMHTGLVIVGIVIVASAGVAAVIVGNDLRFKQNFQEISDFFKICPIYSINIPQPLPYRLISLLHITDSYLTLLLSLKLIDTYIEIVNLGDFYSSNSFLLGAFAFSASEFIILLSYWLRAFLFNNSNKARYLCISFSLWLLADILCLCYFLLINCENINTSWLLNFFIFSLVDTFLMGPLFSICVTKIKKRHLPSTTRAVTLSEAADIFPLKPIIQEQASPTESTYTKQQTDLKGLFTKT